MSHAQTITASLPDPAHAFGGAAPASAGVRAIVRPDARWDPLLVCLAGYILVAVGRVHQVFPAIDAIRPVVLTGLLSIGLYLFDQRRDRRLRLITDGASSWVLALLVWMVLAIPGALVLRSSFDLVFGNVIKTVVMFFVVAAAVRGGRDLERLAGTYLVGCTVYAAVVLARFDVGTTDWRLGHLYYYDANDFATFAVTAMPLALYFAHRGRRLSRRVLSVLALGVLCAAFINSGSRGGFLALLVTAGYIIARYSSIALSRRVAAVAVVGVVLVVVASDRYWVQMSSILSDTDYNHTAESGRLQIWQRGVGYMLQRPVLGLGPGNFEAAEGTLSPFADRQQFGVGVRWNAPHNSFIQTGAELGVPGLILFIGMIASTFLALHRFGRITRARGASLQVRPDLAHALTASLIGFVVGAFFLSLAYSELLYMLLAFGVAAKKVGRMRGPVPVATCVS